MMSVDFSELKRRLGAWRILDTQQYADETPDGELEELINGWVENSLLTRFQATQLLAEEPIPLRFGDYVLQDRLGEGGMGDVFIAFHSPMQRKVALKLIRGEVADNATMERFRREVVAAARLEHTNVVAAYDAGEANGRLYLVTQLIDGCDLEAMVRLHGPLPLPLAADYLIQAAAGLEYAHNQGIIHRDIKPSNLLVDSARTSVRVLDLGLARLTDDDSNSESLTKTGYLMGTVDYMAPEQAEDTRQADARADIYSLGCTFHFLVTGRPAYQAETVVKTILQHRDSEIPQLARSIADLPSDVDRVFRKMVAKKPDERFQSMGEVIRAMQPFTTDNPQADYSWSNQKTETSPANAFAPTVQLTAPQHDATQQESKAPVETPRRDKQHMPENGPPDCRSYHPSRPLVRLRSTVLIGGRAITASQLEILTRTVATRSFTGLV